MTANFYLKPVGLSDFRVNARTNEKKQKKKNKQFIEVLLFQKRAHTITECLSVTRELHCHYCFNFYQ